MAIQYALRDVDSVLTAAQNWLPDKSISYVHLWTVIEGKAVPLHAFYSPTNDRTQKARILELFDKYPEGAEIVWQQFPACRRSITVYRLKPQPPDIPFDDIIEAARRLDPQQRMALIHSIAALPF